MLEDAEYEGSLKMDYDKLVQSVIYAHLPLEIISSVLNSTKRSFLIQDPSDVTPTFFLAKLNAADITHSYSRRKAWKGELNVFTIVSS